jgi:hypothetical protein
MVAASEFLSRQLALLAGVAAPVSNKLSIMTLLGLTVAALLPDGAPSATARQTSPPVEAPKPVAGSKEIIRARPIPIRAAAAPAAQPAHGDSAPAPVLQVVAQRPRDRKQPDSESSRPGKAAAPEKDKAGAPEKEKTPVPPADPKTATPQAEPEAPDQWSDAEIIAGLKDCLKRLAPLGAEIEIAEPVRQERCGAPAPVVLKRMTSGAGKVEFQPAPTLNCAMVARLHTWVEKTLQPAAQEFLGSPVTRIRNASGYVCRNRVGSVFHGDRLSEHALANAIDIAGFVTADGRSIDVLSKWGPNVRDLREQQERAAELAEDAREAARAADKEAVTAARAVNKAPRGDKREQAKADAAKMKEEAQRKRDEADRLEAERRKLVLRIAELVNPARSSDAKSPTPSSGRGRREASAKDAKGQKSRQRDDEEEDADTKGPAPEAAFLRRLHRGACETFSTVLGPDANEAHRNHFHFDLASRRRSGSYCQ